MRVRAQAKWVRTSARKARVVLEHIRGRSVPEARTILAFTPRAAATDIEKVLRSAVANAEANHGLDGDELVVESAFADEGPTLKRWKPRARGRVNRIRKRTCHVTLILAEVPEQNTRRRPRKQAADETTSASAKRRRLRGSDPRRRRLPDGPESASRRLPRRRHPRLEVQLVDGQARVRRLHSRGRPHPRAHPREAVARGPLGHPHPQGQAADHGGHLHRAPGHRHREVRRRGGRAAQRAARDHEEERPHQHQRDQASRARREARRAVDRGTARESGQLPTRDEALPRVCDAVGCARDQDHGRRPARRR